MKITNRLVFRITFLVVTCIFISGATSVYLTIKKENSLFSDEKKSQIITLTKLLALRIINELASFEKEKLAEAVEKIIRNSDDVYYCIVVNEKGRVVFDSRFKNEGKILYDPISKAAFNADSANPLIIQSFLEKDTNIPIKEIAMPVLEENIKFGVVRVGYKPFGLFEIERMRRILLLGKVISDSAKNKISEMDIIGIKDIISKLVEDEKDIRYCVITDKDNISFFHTDEKLENKKMDKFYDSTLFDVNPRIPFRVERKFDKKNSEWILNISVLIEKEGEKEGIILLGYSLEGLNSKLKKSFLNTIYVGMLFFAVGLLVAIFVARQISKPVLHLSKISQEVKHGNFEVRASSQYSGSSEIKLLIDSFNEMIIGLKERELVKETFSRYVTKSVAEELIKNPYKIKVGGTKQEVTILFADIRGFTTIAEKLSPEDTMSHLNEYLSAMIDVIFKYEGTLDKFIGDAIMAVFGVPLPHRDDAMRAVKTALEMQTRLEELNKKWADKHQPLLQIGIGINTGEVIAGNIGDMRRMEYTVIGDNVNLASRIETLTKEYNVPIIITESTLEKIDKQSVSVQPLGITKVKGKTVEVKIFGI